MKKRKIRTIPYRNAELGKWYDAFGTRPEKGVPLIVAWRDSYELMCGAVNYTYYGVLSKYTEVFPEPVMRAEDTVSVPFAWRYFEDVPSDLEENADKMMKTIKAKIDESEKEV